MAALEEKKELVLSMECDSPVCTGPETVDEKTPGRVVGEYAGAAWNIEHAACQPLPKSNVVRKNIPVIETALWKMGSMGRGISVSPRKGRVAVKRPLCLFAPLAGTVHSFQPLPLTFTPPKTTLLLFRTTTQTILDPKR